MCLGAPGQVVSVRGNIAVVDFWGIRKEIRLDNLTETILAGDYVIDHQGYAVRKIDDDAVAETLGMYEVILCEAGCDPIATDVVRELESADDIDDVSEPVLV
jgi:hydrogenase expression/formation protein HypC